VIYPGSSPVGNATLVVANVLTCNKYSQKKICTISIVQLLYSIRTCSLHAARAASCANPQLRIFHINSTFITN
jgi:hypothetical protein